MGSYPSVDPLPNWPHMFKRWIMPSPDYSLTTVLVYNPTCKGFSPVKSSRLSVKILANSQLSVVSLAAVFWMSRNAWRALRDIQKTSYQLPISESDAGNGVIVT